MLGSELDATEAAQLHAAVLRSRKGSLRAGRNHAGLELRYRRHLLQHELAGSILKSRQVGKPHIDPCIEQPR